MAMRTETFFGDIWCQFVSVGPAPHIYQRGERVGEPVCTMHGHYPDYLVVGPRFENSCDLCVCSASVNCETVICVG